MANGKVCTGFSKPYVAVLGSNGYTDGQILARGVEVSIEPESSDPENFYVDNIIGETIGGEFTGGTCTLTVDGLLQDAERLVAGLPAPDSEGFLNYGNDQATPYVGIGFVMRYISGGVTSYAPVILTKAILNPQTLSGATQEESVDFQTQELEFALTRDDNGVWKKVGDGLATEALAEAKIQTFFGITQG